MSWTKPKQMEDTHKMLTIIIKIQDQSMRTKTEKNWEELINQILICIPSASDLENDLSRYEKASISESENELLSDFRLQSVHKLFPVLRSTGGRVDTSRFVIIPWVCAGFVIIPIVGLYTSQLDSDYNVGLRKKRLLFFK